MSSHSDEWCSDEAPVAVLERPTRNASREFGLHEPEVEQEIHEVEALVERDLGGFVLGKGDGPNAIDDLMAGSKHVLDDDETSIPSRKDTVMLSEGDTDPGESRIPKAMPRNTSEAHVELPEWKDPRLSLEARREALAAHWISGGHETETRPQETAADTQAMAEILEMEKKVFLSRRERLLRVLKPQAPEPQLALEEEQISAVLEALEPLGLKTGENEMLARALADGDVEVLYRFMLEQSTAGVSEEQYFPQALADTRLGTEAWDKWFEVEGELSWVAGFDFRKASSLSKSEQAELLRRMAPFRKMAKGVEGRMALRRMVERGKLPVDIALGSARELDLDDLPLALKAVRTPIYLKAIYVGLRDGAFELRADQIEMVSEHQAELLTKGPHGAAILVMLRDYLEVPIEAYQILIDSEREKLAPEFHQLVEAVQAEYVDTMRSCADFLESSLEAGLITEGVLAKHLETSGMKGLVVKHCLEPSQGEEEVLPARPLVEKALKKNASNSINWESWNLHDLQGDRIKDQYDALYRLERSGLLYQDDSQTDVKAEIIRIWRHHGDYKGYRDRRRRQEELDRLHRAKLNRRHSSRLNKLLGLVGLQLAEPTPPILNP